jgi:hypothetical protein
LLQAASAPMAGSRRTSEARAGGFVDMEYSERKQHVRASHTDPACPDLGFARTTPPMRYALRMALLRVVDGEDRRTIPLAASTLIGRGWPCLVRLEHRAAPLYWLEVRWHAGAWAWRTLSADARTRATGAFVANGWRTFTAAGGRGARVTLAEDLWVELTDASPPTAFLTDVESGAPVSPDAVDDALELRADAVLPVSAEGAEDLAYRDGAVIRVGHRVVRVHVPARDADTLGGRVDLSAPDVELDLDDAALVARFTRGDAGVVARGACVRLLAVYVAAREADVPSGGWLTPDEAHAEWVARGAPPDSRPDRVAWERAKLRAQLSRAGATGLDALYEIRRDGETVRTRVRAF